MPRNINNLLIKTADEFLRLAQQGDDPDEDEPQEDLNTKVERLRRELNQAVQQQKLQQGRAARSQPADEQQQTQQQQQQPQQQAQPQQTPYDVIITGLKGEVYDEITQAGQALKGKFNGELFGEISKIFNKELFYHALIGRGDRDNMRELVAKNKIRLGVTVTANTNSDGNVGLRFWATDPSFRSKYPQQTAAVEQQLNQVPRNIIYNAIQTIAQTSGLDTATPKPIVVNTYFNVVDNNGNVSYTQL